ncbi:MAG: response regulator transcription factor [Lachnospiraceae bacterium]|nr:response regulator transcription factor [Lachnospiraceae bacterium]
MIKILIVDDEQPICDLIDMNLSAAGYACVAVQDGLAAIEAVEKNTFDLVLLDIMLPGADGYDVMEYIRPFKVPVIFISAKHEVKDRVKGLKLGADDYLIKPFDVTELLARVEAVLRRYNKTDKVITLGDVEIDVEARRVKRGGSPVSLTSKEFDLMLLFVENRNVALFRENLYERVWDDEYFANSRTLDLHVQRLRRKLGWEKNLVAVYKVGYRLEL